MLSDGIKCNQKIIQKINQNMLPQISTRQLNNLKARLKITQVGGSASNLTEIISWCQARRMVPVDEDQVFCGGIEFKVDDKDQLEYLRIFITTKRLISITQKRKDFFTHLLIN